MFVAEKCATIFGDLPDWLRAIYNGYGTITKLPKVKQQPAVFKTHWLEAVIITGGLDENTHMTFLSHYILQCTQSAILCNHNLFIACKI